MNIEIRINGEGTESDIIKSLEDIIEGLKSNSHVERIKMGGVTVWEDPTLITTIIDGDDDDDDE